MPRRRNSDSNADLDGYHDYMQAKEEAAEWLEWEAKRDAWRLANPEAAAAQDAAEAAAAAEHAKWWAATATVTAVTATVTAATGTAAATGANARAAPEKVARRRAKPKRAPTGPDAEGWTTVVGKRR